MPLKDTGKYAILCLSAVSCYEILVMVVNQLGVCASRFINHQIKKDWGKQYEIISELGNGKTSTIYKVKRKSDNETIAIKVLNKFNLIVLESNAFTVETTILEKANHPYIVSCYGTRSTNTYDLIELECATDGCLYSYVHDHGPLSELLVVRFIQEMMSAMVYLSEHFDIVHRDIKPENILVFKRDFESFSLEDRFYKSIQRENEIDFKLCDFGFSDKHGICGTEYYTEPHVYKGCQHHTIVSDMWSLGIVAHFALFGTNPMYQLLRNRDIESYMPTILMKKDNWERLGPILRNIGFFSFCLSYNTQKREKDVKNLYKEMIGRRKLSSPTFEGELLNSWFFSEDGTSPLLDRSPICSVC